VRPLIVAAIVGALVAVPSAASALTVYAASSLSKTFPKIDATASYSFAGSDVLAFQIQQGAPADVFASAAPLYAQQLHAAGLCDTPVTFALNTLRFVTPRSNLAHITDVQQLQKPGGYRIAIGQRTVPLGIYSRTLLGKLGLGRALQHNTVSQYPKASDVTTAIGLGSADAGFVYTTDWYANTKRLAAWPIPDSAQPLIRYQLCAVTRPGADTAGAKAFITKVLSLNGRKALQDAHFGLPPKS
jgi:molybdate transport system substrate-binding protein